MTETQTDTTIYGLINWVEDFGPLPRMTDYAGDCTHPVSRPVAFGWDNTHHQLVECLPCGSRAWVGVKRACGCSQCGQKPAILHVSTPWTQPEDRK